MQGGTRWVEWGSLPAGKQVSWRKNAGIGQGKRAAQPFHLAAEVPEIPQRPETEWYWGGPPVAQTPPNCL